MKQYSSILKIKDDNPFISHPEGNDFSGFNFIKIEKLEKMSNEAFDKAVIEGLDIPDNTKIYKEIKIG